MTWLAARVLARKGRAMACEGRSLPEDGLGSGSGTAFAYDAALGLGLGSGSGSGSGSARGVINGAIGNNASDPDKGLADAADGLALQIVKRRDPATQKFCGMAPCTVSVNDTRVDVVVNRNTIEISGHPASKGKCTLNLAQVWPAS